MFDTTYRFEELPLRIGAYEVSHFTGTVALSEDGGSFVVTGIELEDPFDSSQTVQISERHDDWFCRLLFIRLATALYRDTGCIESFDADFDEFKRETYYG